jgi:hypothetical protein
MCTVHAPRISEAGNSPCSRPARRRRLRAGLGSHTGALTLQRDVAAYPLCTARQSKHFQKLWGLFPETARSLALTWSFRASRSAFESISRRTCLSLPSFAAPWRPIGGIPDQQKLRWPYQVVFDLFRSKLTARGLVCSLLKRLENIVGSRPDLYLDLDLRKELVAARQYRLYRGSVPRLVQLLAKSHAGLGRTFEVGPLLPSRCPPSMRVFRDCGHSRFP